MVESAHRWRVAVLGPLGTYTHEAAYSHFGTDVQYDEQATIKDVFAAVSSSSPVGVVPQENTIFGGVIDTYDALRDMGFVRGDIILRVRHCLLVRDGVKLGDIRRVFSHEQALGQCQKFLETDLPAASLIRTTSTAAAARGLLKEYPDCAAICSRVCATLFGGLTVLCDGIQDMSENFTRFYIIAKDVTTDIPASPSPLEPCQALLRISTSTAGAKNISQLLSVLRIGISRIDRRPSLGTVPFHNIYFVELQRQEGPSTQCDWRLEVQASMQRVKDESGDVQLVGLW